MPFIGSCHFCATCGIAPFAEGPRGLMVKINPRCAGASR